jgi:DNA repair exonuclease SbcCD ATPase subunit
VKCYIGPHKKKMKRKTQIKKKDLNPVYKENFWYDSWPKNQQLTASVWDWDSMKKNTFMGEVVLDFPDDTSGVVSGSFALKASSKYRGEEVTGTIRLTIINYEIKAQADAFEAKTAEMASEINRLEKDNAEKDLQNQSMEAQVKHLKKIAEASLEHNLEESNARSEKLKQILLALRAAKDEKGKLKEKLNKMTEERKELQAKVDALQGAMDNNKNADGTAGTTSVVLVGADRIAKKLEDALNRERKLKETANEIREKRTTAEKKCNALALQLEALREATQDRDVELLHNLNNALDRERMLKEELDMYKDAKIREKEYKNRINKVEKEKIVLTMSRENLALTLSEVEAKNEALTTQLTNANQSLSEAKFQLAMLESEKEKAMQTLEQGKCKVPGCDVQ